MSLEKFFGFVINCENFISIRKCSVLEVVKLRSKLSFKLLIAILMVKILKQFRMNWTSNRKTVGEICRLIREITLEFLVKNNVMLRV